MKVSIFSDLHCEFHQDNGKSLINSLDNNCDVCCCAGDLATPNLLEDALRRLCDRFSQVVFVLGNHDLYSSDFVSVFKMLDKLMGKVKNLHWLENREVELGGQRFIGATLWFERAKDSLDLKHFLNDFTQIKNFESLVFAKFGFSKSYLAANIKESDIVLTHHLPSFKCVDSQFVGSKYNIYFASELDDMIKKNKPKLFISGHSHCSYDFNLGVTRMIANPFGYANDSHDLNPKFKDNLIIDI